jgi:adenosylhomocysteine nucleosidase
VTHRVVVIISADAEWSSTKKILSPAKVDRSPYGECFVMDVGGEPILLFHGGWGKISAAASTEHAIATWQPQVIINLGTCGGIAGLVQQGEKLLVTRTLVYDIREGIGDQDESIRAYTTDIDTAWLGDDFPVTVRRLLLVSADRDLIPSDVPDIVARHGAVAADWESAAIAYVARRRGTHLLILRAVSDLVDAERGEAEAIGNLSLYQTRCDGVMQSLFEDLSRVVPFALERLGLRPLPDAFTAAEEP